MFVKFLVPIVFGLLVVFAKVIIVNVLFMNTKCKFVVRVLFNDLKRTETLESYSNLSDAVDKFVFYVRAVLEFNLDVRVVNIFKGKKSIKMFQNY